VITRPIPIPTLRLQCVCLSWLILACAAIAFESARTVWEFAGLLLASCCLADLWLGRAQGCPLEIRRHMQKSWSVGVAQTVQLHLANGSRRARLLGRLFDGVPSAFEYTGFPHAFIVDAHGRHELEYRALAKVRGPHRFGTVEVLLDTPLRLWSWRHRVAALDSDPLVRVFPDFARIAHYTLLATDHRLSQIGLLRRRRRGEGLEFHQLREYRQGDTPRQIDWKATARQGKLIARDYQDERNQQLMFLLDCGLRMRTRETEPSEDGRGDGKPGLSHFDHTLNAMLLLSYVALRQGDGVGLATFAHPEPRFLGPRRSQATLTHLLDAVYDLEPTTRTPDFLVAGRLVANRVRKRSLIVLLTNLRDEDDDTLMPALALLRRQHLVVVASLREPGLMALRRQRVRHFEDALAYAAATEYLSARQRSMTTLRKTGVHCLDVAPGELPIALVNQYWSMKRSGVL
jgi:uncharacterized protein (DUF58 family)